MRRITLMSFAAAALVLAVALPRGITAAQKASKHLYGAAQTPSLIS